MYRSTLNGMSGKISRLLTKMLMEDGSTGIDRHLTADAFSTHDPTPLSANQNLKQKYEKK